VGEGSKLRSPGRSRHAVTWGRRGAWTSGAYGIVDDVALGGDFDRVVVKWQKRPGRGVLEKRQLEELRRHAEVKVPEVFYYHAESDDLPFEALAMERIAGVPASELKPPDEPERSRLARDIVDVLLRWHSVRNTTWVRPSGRTISS
jgi:hypothetical protein